MKLLIVQYFQVFGPFAIIMIFTGIGMLSISIFLINRGKLVGVFVPLSYVLSLSPFLLLGAFVFLPHWVLLNRDAHPSAKVRLAKIESETFLTKLEYPNNDVSVCIENSSTKKEQVIRRIKAGERGVVFRILEKGNNIDLFYICDGMVEGCDTTEHQIDSLNIKIQPTDINTWESTGVFELKKRDSLGRRIPIF